MDRRSSADSDSDSDSSNSLPQSTDAERLAIEALANELARIRANRERLERETAEIIARNELMAQFFDALQRADSSK